MIRDQVYHCRGAGANYSATSLVGHTVLNGGGGRGGEDNSFPCHTGRHGATPTPTLQWLICA